MKKLLIPTFIILFLSACAGPSHFLSPAFKSKGPTHNTLAVLPFEVKNTGKPPKNMTEEQIQKLNEEESTTFQQSLYNQLQNNLGGFHLQIQPPNKTNNILRENGVELLKTASKNPDDLAKLLGVDAVVFSTVTKHRYLSDNASLGIDAGKQVLRAVTRGQSDPYTWGVSSKTNDMLLSCSLIDSKDGEVLWKKHCKRPTDWNSPPHLIVEKINRKVAKSFPYRKLRKGN